MYWVSPETCLHSLSPGWCNQLRTAPTVGFHLALQCISTALLSDELWSDPLPVFILISVFSFQSTTCPFLPVGSIACALLETKRRDHVDSAYFLAFCEKKRKNSSHPRCFICLWHTPVGHGVILWLKVCSHTEDVTEVSGQSAWARTHLRRPQTTCKYGQIDQITTAPYSVQTCVDLYFDY